MMLLLCLGVTAQAALMLYVNSEVNRLTCNLIVVRASSIYAGYCSSEVYWFDDASPPMSRRERVLAHKSLIFSQYIGKQQEFLDFVLEQYIKAGVGELDRSKLPQLLELKYHAVRDAVTELGSVANISEVFVGFQQYLYSQDVAA